MNSPPRKFRVWDGEEMHYPPHGYVRDGRGRVFRTHPLTDDSDDTSSLELVSDNHEDMDYTGLDDAEGNEIYEGDIVETCCGRGVVNYANLDAAFAAGGRLLGTTQLTLLGNRYENPELLEEVAG